MSANIIEDANSFLEVHKNHSLSNIIGNLYEGVKTRSKSGLINLCLFSCFLSQVEPKNVDISLTINSWVEAMQEELLQFKK